MTKLQIQIEQFEQIIARLKDVMNKERNEYMRDSAIKRFEIAFDLSWKLVKTFLEEKHGVICKSPKSCFREAYKQSVIEYDEFWIEMTNLRNEVAHIYREETADKIYGKLDDIIEYFEKLLKTIKA